MQVLLIKAPAEVKLLFLTSPSNNYVKWRAVHWGGGISLSESIYLIDVRSCNEFDCLFVFYGLFSCRLDFSTCESIRQVVI